ncbi:serine/threonine-protein kinase MRCK alpha [Microplitis demolitor]|uniref:serine/threonine-protein kinase MRCK alpha n=1 Tax=Microplitis demolitor TaxID=69319 RepID=UPI0004CCAE9A|nr:serine/threonine-protein kinase MRCK alpha [Microplitis demolitor]
MENSNSRDNVQALMLQDQNLTEKIEKVKNNLKILRNEQILLSSSNWKMEIDVMNLQLENKHLEDEVNRKNQSFINMNKNCKQCKDRNKKELQDFRGFFDNESRHYCDLLSNAKNEYDSESLKTDIENYERQIALLNNDYKKIQTDMDKLTQKFGLIELGTNEKAEQVNKIKSTINFLENYESVILSAVKSYKNKIRDLSKKIEQKERDILSAADKKIL